MGDDTGYLAKLRDYYARHGVLPPYSQIMALTGFRSKSPVAALVARLRLQGYLESTPDKRLKPGPRFFERAVFDGIRAGLPDAVNEPNAELLTIDSYLIKHPSQTVLVRVKGDSMIGAGIHEGDIVVVERRAMAGPGEMVVAVVDEEFTLKYLDRDHAGYYLRPANPAYGPIRPKGKGKLEIFGVVVGMFRRY
jgi:SOS-response transcriptional repressor LexA